jgi:hypothetical protein
MTRRDEGADRRPRNGDTDEEETSVFDEYFDDPYAEFDEEFDEDEPEEHPLSTRQTRRRRYYRGGAE